MNIKRTLILILALLSLSVADIKLIKKSVPTFTLSHKLSPFEYKKFLDHTEERLPQFHKMFIEYSKKHNMPWTLLAAVAYQESKWNELAVSPTGAKGLMQITLQTATHLGITDRDNALQSVQGGASYLNYLYNKTPSSLNSSQRWILALCAYNIGWGHLQDAKKLAYKQKIDPYNWSQFKKVLPQLENEKHYSGLRHGFARGTETVDFVNKVFYYYNLLNDTYNLESQIAKFDNSKI